LDGIVSRFNQLRELLDELRVLERKEFRKQKAKSRHVNKGRERDRVKV